MIRSRFMQVLLGLATVVAAYWVYAFAAVPLIEPPPTVRKNKSDLTAELAKVKPGRRRWEEPLRQMVAGNSWELGQPKVVETQQAVLFFQDYRTLPDGRMELKPCSVLFTPVTNTSTNTESHGRVALLQAPEGALLEFDKPLDLKQAEFGQLVGGRLVGEVTIRSTESKPGARDQLHLVTRNVQMDQQRVWTPHEVDFRFGPNYGRGRDLIMTLLPMDDGLGKKRGPNIGGLKSIELVHVDKLHLESRSGDLFPSAANSQLTQQALEGLRDATDGRITALRPDPTSSATPGGGNQAQNLPLEVTCKGPFVLDLLNGVATFEDQVDVLRLHPDGPTDQLNCRLLELYFQQQQNEQPKERASELSDPQSRQAIPSAIELTKVVAQGHPVLLRSPASGAFARGERLEYDAVAHRIRLEGVNSQLVYQGRRIDASGLQYEMADGGRLGQVWAVGPGRFVGQIAPGEPQQVSASWNERLRLRPDGVNQLLSLVGAASVNLGEAGSMSAEELHLWLLEVPKDIPRLPAEVTARKPLETSGASPLGSASQVNIVPDRLLAEGTVKLESPQFSASTGRLEVWFKNEAPAIGDAETPMGQAERTNSPFGRRDDESATVAASHYHLVGKLVRVLLVRRGEETQLRDATVEGEVDVRETQTADPTQVPLLVRGDKLQVTGADTPSAAIAASGKPAEIAARGMSLRAGDIQIDRAGNRAWIEGAGTMTFPLNRDPSGTPLSEPRPVTVTWQESMNFDGKLIALRKDVVVRTEFSSIAGPALDITLAQPLNFAQPGRREDVAVQQIKFHGAATMHNRTVGPQGLTSIDQMQVNNLTLDHLSGDVYGDGPGWVQTVRRGAARMPGVAQPEPRMLNASHSTDDAQLTYLHVTFQRGLAGNMHKKQLEFLDDVKATYGPVNRWDGSISHDEPAGPAEGVVLLRCDRMQAAVIGEQVDGRAPMELHALGNTLVEGQTFTARAHRLSYAQSKDLLVMEGDGRSDAELFRQTQVGGPTARAAARKILYWPQSGRAEVDNAEFLDWSGMIGGSNPLPPVSDGVRRILGPQDRSGAYSTAPR